MKRPAVFPPRTYCTGGWCVLRDTCQFHETRFRGDKDRRLCPSGTTQHYLAVEFEERTNSVVRHPRPVSPSRCNTTPHELEHS